MDVVSRFGMAILAVGLILSVGAGYRTSAISPQGEEEAALPQPERSGGMSLREALARRRSVREFAPRPLTRQQLGQLLWAAQGITGREGKRTAPSAGALYPLEIYVATASGLYHYQPRGHQLERRGRSDLRAALSRAAHGQSAVADAAAVFVIAAEPQRTARKYGPVRSLRYVYLEAGHAAQNLLLEAVGLELGGVPVGAFDDDQVGKVLGLTANEHVVYVIAIGHPR